jgi:hypothetical protein
LDICLLLEHSQGCQVILHLLKGSERRFAVKGHGGFIGTFGLVIWGSAPAYIKNGDYCGSPHSNETVGSRRVQDEKVWNFAPDVVERFL